MAAEVPLEDTEHLARDLRTLAGEKEIADLEAVMSGNALQADGLVKSKCAAMRDGTLILAKLALATLPVTEARAAAISALHKFFVLAKEAAASSANT